MTHYIYIRSMLAPPLQWTNDPPTKAQLKDVKAGILKIIKVTPEGDYVMREGGGFFDGWWKTYVNPISGPLSEEDERLLKRVW